MRKTCRSNVTKLINLLNDNLVAENVTESNILVFKRRLETAAQKLKEATERAMSFLKEAEFEEECEKIVEYEDRIVETITLAENKITQLQVEKRHLMRNRLRRRLSDWA